MLKELGIVSSNDTKAEKIFNRLFPDLFEIPYNAPSDFIKILWGRYTGIDNRSSSLNGKMFEYILATLCIREKILPIYLEARVAFVPNVEYDLMFYAAERGPICWSVKTSLRERYKQADLEAIALKYVHRRALSYLVTLEEREAKSVKAKIKSGDVIGLDGVVVAIKPEFDDLVAQLKKYDFVKPPTLPVLVSSKVVTKEKVDRIRSEKIGR